MSRLLLVLLAGFALKGAVAASQVEIENNWVRVLRDKQEPHERDPLLQMRPAAVVVYLTDAYQKLTGGDGTAHEIRHKAGETAYLEAGRRAQENLLNQTTEAVLIELKPVKVNAAPVALDPVKLDPKYHLVDFENDRVRVLRTILEPHIKSPMHEHPAYVVVYLTDLHTTMKMADGREVDNPRKPGEIAWRDALKHQTENIGDHTAMEIQVELK